MSWRNCFVFSFRDGDTDFITSLKEKVVLKVTMGKFSATDEEVRYDWKLYRGSNREIIGRED